MSSDINNTKSNDTTVRVRYAPSPTGDPHVGNIRTAIFTWLYAKNKSGTFVVRIEDTDQSRTIQGALENILDSLNWLSINWDEGPSDDKPFGPYLQSKRLEKYYIPFAEQLVKNGHAYKCYCSQKRLSEVRETRRIQKLETSYDRRCRHLTTEQQYDFDKNQTPAVIRFAMPLEGEWELSDIIRGKVKFQNKVIDDFIIIKSDGYPTYHLANVIDDHCMEISHVIRANVGGFQPRAL
jgi:glutamyl-tRNA synthetase